MFLPFPVAPKEADLILDYPIIVKIPNLYGSIGLDDNSVVTNY